MLISQELLNKKLFIYEKLLIKWSSALNLVAKSTLTDIHHRHFQDSLQLIEFLSDKDKILDIGTGAGFPGLVLAMAGYNVTLLDSNEKKCIFLENVSRETNTNVRIICSRIEDYKPKGYFDVITSRGVASLFDLIKLSEIYSKKKHTYGLFLKGEHVDIELKGIDSNKFEKVPSKITPCSYIIKYFYL